MPVGHLKLNNPNVDPNPDITFIRELKQKPNSEKARQLLDAVAAQFKPITKKFGFGVNSFEEYEWNPEFSGRNWNGGEVIELVLRNRDDSFKPYSSILSTMCHELAHIKEMNHSKYFWEKNNEIRGELHQLRANGYFGDGFWSAGTMLTGANVPGQILKEEDQPMYPCGGAINRRRKRQRRNPRNNNDERGGSRRERGSVSKLGHTGRQTRIQRKPGGRVTREGAFKGEGKVMDDDPEMSTFRRRANAPSAIAARADAAQRRMEMDKVAKKKKEQASKKFKTDLSLDIKPKLKDDAKEKGKGKEMVNELEIIDLCDSSDDEKAREGDGTDDLDEIEDGDSDEEPDTDDEEFEFEDPGMQITDEAELAQIKAEVFAEDDFILSSGTAAGGSGTNKKPPAPFAQAPSASAPLNKNSQVRTAV
ncbi:WLM-domain-containing protein [Meredithblackwellia eburnea MCA 4105]